MCSSDLIDKLIMLEPRGWLDHAVKCVVHDGGNGYRCVYDADKLIELHTMWFAYGESGYKYSPDDTYEAMLAKSSDSEADAVEWVHYNTLRGSDYLGANRPLFTRNRVY